VGATGVSPVSPCRRLWSEAGNVCRASYLGADGAAFGDDSRSKLPWSCKTQAPAEETLAKRQWHPCELSWSRRCRVWRQLSLQAALVVQDASTGRRNTGDTPVAPYARSLMPAPVESAPARSRLQRHKYRVRNVMRVSCYPPFGFIGTSRNCVMHRAAVSKSPPSSPSETVGIRFGQRETTSHRATA